MFLFGFFPINFLESPWYWTILFSVSAFVPAAENLKSNSDYKKRVTCDKILIFGITLSAVTDCNFFSQNVLAG